jgi:Protein of unknown function (DUF3309)
VKLISKHVGCCLRGQRRRLPRPFLGRDTAISWCGGSHRGEDNYFGIIVAQEDRRGYADARSAGDRAVTLTTILLIILILILIGVIPTWPHSRDWGYVPGGVVGVILIILLILLLTGRI